MGDEVREDGDACGGESDAVVDADLVPIEGEHHAEQEGGQEHDVEEVPHQWVNHRDVGVDAQERQGIERQHHRESGQRQFSVAEDTE